MKDQLDRLRAVAPRLNGASDAMNRAIIDIESQLAALNLGIAAQIKVEPSGPVLGYGKFSEAWCFYFGNHKLTSAPRAMRVEAITGGWIERLLSQIATEAEALATSVESAANQCEAIKKAI
jgi:hypothetical protein